ncbi:MAG: hypothetical protein JWM65_3846 [Sphingomonas bacterium]|nr:hypothetical protein [Sphingomonas bacterium]
MSLFLFIAAQALPIPSVAPATPSTVAVNPAIAPLAIDWQVVDRFRLFDHATTTARQKIEAVMAALAKSAAPQDDKALYDQLWRTLSGDTVGESGNTVDGWSLRASNIEPPPPKGRQSNKYRATYLYPAQYVIRATAVDAPAGAQCHWTVGGLPAEPVSDGGQEAAGACTAHLIKLPALPGGGGASGDVGLTVDSGPAQPAVTIAFNDELVVALGDSYISGEGSPDVPTVFHPRDQGKRFVSRSWATAITADRRNHDGTIVPGDATPAIWWDQRCHRSLLSWPVLASLMHASRDQHRAVTLVHLGCSGAETKDILSSGPGQRDLPGGGDDEQGQLAMLDLLLSGHQSERPLALRRGVDTLFVSIGGNDVGFAGVIKMMLLTANGAGPESFIVNMSGRFAQAVCPYRIEPDTLRHFCRKGKSSEDRLDKLGDALRVMADNFARRKFAPGRIFQVSYPNPLIDLAQAMCSTPAGAGDGGYDGLHALVPRPARPLDHIAFQLTYHPDVVVADPSSLPPDKLGPIEGATWAGAACDWNNDPSDSEMCQAYWVWASLKRKIERSAGSDITVVSDYQDAIRSHGVCNVTDAAPFALPIADGHGGWKGQWAPGAFQPNDFALPRWFRTGNDSIATEWASGDDFHYGTVHPTFHAHLVLAAAMEAQAFGGH